MGALTWAELTDLASLRQRDVDRAVLRRINDCDGDVSTAQIKEWTNEEYRRWRELWPNLNALFIAHEAFPSEAVDV